MKQRKRKHSQFFNKSELLLSNYEQANGINVMHFLCPKWHTIVGNGVFLGQQWLQKNLQPGVET
jgi:hypothetical protein